jgi:hypothetical protein
MRELELTWYQVIRIWWAAFWRWVVLSNLTVGAALGTVAIGLWASGIRHVPMSAWIPNAIIVLSVPAAVIAVRLALKAKYKGFRIAIVAPPEDGTE